MFQALLVIICKLFQKHQITPVVEPLDVLSFRKQRNFANNEAVNSFFHSQNKTAVYRYKICQRRQSGFCR